MRKLTDTDLADIAGTIISGYRVEKVRIKRGQFSDSDYYGIILGRNNSGDYVTWQFHLLEDGSIHPYWGHYHMENREAALRDYNYRDAGERSFRVTITETLKLTVDVDAADRHEAEQIVSDKWRNSEYVLGSENFVGVEFVFEAAENDSGDVNTED